MVENSVILIFDGHDGTGKTTLAKALSKVINAQYLRPFEGKTGEALIEAANAEDFDKVITIGRMAIHTKIDSVTTHKPLIFDRHWLTVLSLLPETYQKCWPYQDKTYSFLCTAPLQTVKERLHTRKEKKFEDTYHSHYLKKYQELAAKCNVQILDTQKKSVEELIKDLKVNIPLKI